MIAGGVLALGLLFGFVTPAAAAGMVTLDGVQAQSATIDTVTKLDGTTTYNSDLYITKNLDLNGQILRVKGDLTIGAAVTLNKGVLVVEGNVLHTAGRVDFSQGSIEVSGDYRIQDRKVTASGGYEYIESSGTLMMEKADDYLKVGGDLVIQSTGRNLYGYNYYRNGTIEVGGNFIQKNGSVSNFCGYGTHTVILTGTRPQVEFESDYGGFGHLQVTSGNIICNGYLNFSQLDSNLSIQVSSGNELVLTNAADLNGKTLSVQGDVCLKNGVNLNAGTLNVSGNVLHTGGRLSFSHGTMTVAGDYRVQDRKAAAGGSYEYISSAGTLVMQQADDHLKVGGDLVIQSTGGNQSGANYYQNGTIEVAGNFTQKNGSASNFCGYGTHKVILTGTKPQTVTFESTTSGFATLQLTQPLGNYTFNPNPCWATLIQVETPAETPVSVPAKGTTLKSGNVTYKVTNAASENPTVAYAKPGSTSTSVSIPSTITINDMKYSVTSIDANAFKGNKKVTKVTVNKSITSIGSSAFYGCTNLKTVSGCSGVTSIGTNAFYGCTKLTAVSGCSKVTSVGNKAFYKCAKLTKIGSASGTVTLSKVKTIGSSAFYGCAALKKVNLTSTVLTSIGSSAFQGCTALTSFTEKSAKLTTIGSKAFYGDKKLAAITLKSTKLTKSKVGSSALKGIKSTCKFKVPSSKIKTYKSIFTAKGAGSKITVTK